MGSFNLSSVDCSKLPSEILEILEKHEERLAKQRSYYERNKKKALAYGHNYYMEHREECRARSRAYYYKKKHLVEKAISEAKTILSNSSNKDFNVNVPFGGSNSPMSQERQYEEMKQSGKANCTFESFKVARQMIDLGNSIIFGEASL